jgi:hypothetical protein
MVLLLRCFLYGGFDVGFAMAVAHAILDASHHFLHHIGDLV